MDDQINLVARTRMAGNQMQEKGMNHGEQMELIRQMVAAKNPQEIMDLGFSIFGNPMFFHANDGSLDFYTKIGDIQDENWQKDIVEGGLMKNMIRDFARDGEALFESFIETGKPVIPPSPLGDQTKSLVMPIFHHGNPMGELVLNEIINISEGEEEIEETQKLLRLVGEIFQQKYSSYLEHGSGKFRLEDSTFIRLIEGAHVEPQVVREHIEASKWKPRRYLRVLIIQLRILPQQGISELPDMVEYLRKDKHNLLIQYRGRWVYIFSSDKKKVSEDKRFIELREFIDKCDMMMGMSHSFENFMAVHKFYDQADRSIKIGAEMSQGQGCVLDFDYLYPYLLFDEYNKNRKMEELISDEIRLIEEYDRKNNTELMDTLYNYLECNMDIVKTSEKMYLHKNTIRYRIRRCEEILETDFSNYSEWFGLLLSFKALEYQRIHHTE